MKKDWGGKVSRNGMDGQRTKDHAHQKRKMEGITQKGPAG